jgi:hypothetical protein
MTENAQADVGGTAVREQLQRTIDIVCEDAARVELWACALNGFAQTVPNYHNPYADDAARKGHGER